MSKRLIESVFPLKQASLDSVHEKTARHGHISTLHLWPARRPLAASRAALVATLLPDPVSADARRDVLDRLGGHVEPKTIRKKLPSGKTEEILSFETVGGILRWGRESAPELQWFREEINKAYGGNAPRVLDPFAGGGAIPLEAMRLGCEVTAMDINPVAWFVLKCTLEYPQMIAAEKRRLPDFVFSDRRFMEALFKSQGLKGALLRTRLERFGLSEDREPQLTGIEAGDPLLDADFAWHVRAWSRFVLAQARRQLAGFYPTYAAFESTDGSARVTAPDRALQLLVPDESGQVSVDSLNSEFGEVYLADKRNSRWIAKPTAAYLWARTVTCKNCRAKIPLLKTRWLCKTATKRTVLTMEPNAERTGVMFGVQDNVPVTGTNPAARRENDKRAGGGTMSRSGAKCPCCNAIMEMEDIRLEGRAGRLGKVMTVVVVEGQSGKEYRLPSELELSVGDGVEDKLAALFEEIPFGVPREPTPKGGSGAARAFSVDGYGIDQWAKLFTPRQLLALGVLAIALRNTRRDLDRAYSEKWSEALYAYLVCGFSRLLDFANMGVQWKIDVPTINHSFVRFALPITWDFAEGNPLGESAGGYIVCADRICTALDTFTSWGRFTVPPHTVCGSAVQDHQGEYDVVLTDPPYYDAIPYSDLMDFFYVWLRRLLAGQGDQFDAAFATPLAPKWDHNSNDGELIDDSSRFNGDKERSKRNYEEGMGRAFTSCFKALKPDGRLVIVFAHKHPDAWETLVSAIIRAGFVVDGSWPIQTEQTSRMRAIASAALASSVWLVCRKRDVAARPGWDNRVLEDMHRNITSKLREFWDAGIRGPDFVWAATGPALEAYSQHPAVRKANNPGELLAVPEFLKHVRRIVVDFVVGRVLLGEDSREDAAGLDDVTTYYLLHRHDFGLEDAPAGTCILYALSCGLSDRELVDVYDLLIRTGGREELDDMEEGQDEEQTDDTPRGSGSQVRLKPWQQRRDRNLGIEVGARALPLIDQVHRLMHLWKAGDLVKVNDYLDTRALRQNKMFHHLLQALIELAKHATEERSLLESISNHVAARGVAPQDELTLRIAAEGEG